ncbi:helix-turn-helix domain-containing protein [Streptomyces sp. LZ34]
MFAGGSRRSGWRCRVRWRLSTRTVAVIRARWGFRDDAVFGRAFKKAYEISPGEYRKRHFQAL